MLADEAAVDGSLCEQLSVFVSSSETIASIFKSLQIHSCSADGEAVAATTIITFCFCFTCLFCQC